MDESKVALFLANYDHQVDQVKKIYALLQKKATAFDENQASSEMVESTGYWMHNLYSAHEDLFKDINSFWENDVDAAGAFHKNLLRSMLLNIEGIRPALLSEKSYQCLNELGSFRHVFRHAYSYGLDDERVAFLLRRVLAQKNLVLNDLETFRQTIGRILQEE